MGMRATDAAGELHCYRRAMLLRRPLVLRLAAASELCPGAQRHRPPQPPENQPVPVRPPTPAHKGTGWFSFASSQIPVRSPRPTASSPSALPENLPVPVRQLPPAQRLRHLSPSALCWRL